MNTINRISSSIILAGIACISFGGYFQQCQAVSNAYDIGDCQKPEVNCTDPTPCKVFFFTTYTCSNLIDNTCSISSGDVNTIVKVYQYTAFGLGCTCHYQDQVPASTYLGGKLYQDNAQCANGNQPPN